MASSLGLNKKAFGKRQILSLSAHLSAVCGVRWGRAERAKISLPVCFSLDLCKRFAVDAQRVAVGASFQGGGIPISTATWKITET